MWTIRPSDNLFKIVPKSRCSTSERQPTKITMKKRTDEHSEEIKRMTEHITNLMTEIALLSIEININVNNLLKVHLNELDELILK